MGKIERNTDGETFSMKKYLIILLLLFLSTGRASGESREDKAYNYHMEAVKESDYQKALIKYKVFTSTYGDTEYYKQNKEGIQAEIEDIKEEIDYAKEKKGEEKILLERKKEEELTKKKKEQEEELKKELEKLQRVKEEYIKKAIEKGSVLTGMTREQVIASWGYPSDKNTSYYGTVIHEQWVYRRGKYDTDYVYFEDGIVTSWQLY